MISRYAHEDAYTYEGSSVLKNKAGHRTLEALKQFERLSVTHRMLAEPPEGVFDYTHLKALHHHLFQDVYDWAGKERTVSISKGNTLFAPPVNIAASAERLFAQLTTEHFLQGLEPERFVQRTAYYMVELNMIHPFREGNGRASRLFLSLLAQNAGYGLNSQRLKTGWLEACIAGAAQGEEAMVQAIRGALILWED